MNSNDYEKLLNMKDKKSVETYVNNNLSEKQKNELESILSDKERLNSILNTEKAKNLLNKLLNRD